jgi:thiamine biosynthesis lipoprotein
VKGWALERAALDLRMRGLRSFTIGAGGDVIARGTAGDGRPWRVGVQHPARADAIAAVLEVGDAGVATSGRYERGDHIVDPRSGAAATALLSATVVGPDLGVADAWATALMVLGTEGLGSVPLHDGYEALVITPDDRVVSTEGMAALRVS